MLNRLSDCWSIEDEETGSNEAGEEIIEHVEDVGPGASVQIDHVTVRRAINDDVDNVDYPECYCIHNADLGGNNVSLPTLLHVAVLVCQVVFSLGLEKSVKP